MRTDTQLSFQIRRMVPLEVRAVSTFLFLKLSCSVLHCICCFHSVFLHYILFTLFAFVHVSAFLYLISFFASHLLFSYVIYLYLFLKLSFALFLGQFLSFFSLSLSLPLSLFLSLSLPLSPFLLSSNLILISHAGLYWTGCWQTTETPLEKGRK